MIEFQSLPERLALDKSAPPAVNLVDLLHDAKVDGLFSGAFAALAANLGCGIAAVFLTWGQIERGPVLIWAALLALLSLARAGLALAYHRKTLAAPRARHWERLYLAGAGLSGAVWGIGAAYLLVPDDPLVRAYIFVILAGLVAGALATHSIHLPAFLVFAVPAIVPPTVVLALQDNPALQTMSGLMALFALAIFWAARSLNATVGGGLQAGFENAALVDELIQSNQENETFRTLFNAAAVMVLILRTDGTVRWTNPRVGEVLGLSPDKLVGQPFGDLVHPDDQRDYLESLAAPAQGARVSSLEIRCRNALGAYRCLHWRVSANPAGDELYVITRDVSEERQANAALARERNFVSALLDAQAALVTVLDSKGRILRWNPACERLTGYTAAEAVGRSPLDLLIPAESEETVRRVLADLTQGRPRNHAQNYWRTKAGELRLIEFSNTTLFDKDGGVEFVISTGQDITERNQAQKALELSEARLAHAQRISRLGSWEWDMTNGVIVWSDELYKIFGRREGEFELSFKTISACVHPEDRAAFVETYDQAFREKKGCSQQSRILLPDGAVRHVYSECEFADTESDKSGILRGIVQDMTERLEAEQALEESEMRFRAILENVPALVFMKDIEGRYLLVNDRWEDIFGIRVEDAIGRTEQDLFEQAEFLEDLRLHDREVLATQKAKSYEERVTLGGQERVFAAVKFPLTDSQGNAYAVGGMATEITERIRQSEAIEAQAKQLEEYSDQLRRSNEQLSESKAKAEQANRAKSEFLANMSHELRTPLNAIIGFSEIMKEATLGPLEERYCSYAKDIYDSGSHLLSVINDILDLSKAEAGRLELDLETFRIDEIAAGCLRMASRNLRADELQFRTEIAEGLPKLSADRRKVSQILINLLSNAVKFTDAGGVITLAATLTEAGAIRITVSDTGIGMKPEDIPVSLEPFSQIDTGLARRHEGTGLGLPLSNRLMQLHDGQFHIQSEEGRGTTVTLTFPAYRTVNSPSLRLVDIPSDGLTDRA